MRFLDNVLQNLLDFLDVVAVGNSEHKIDTAASVAQ